MAQHALTPDDKHARRDAILEAALSLFVAQSDLPSSAQIATAAGLAKGTVYIYFRTKEEIFIALLERGVADFLTKLEDSIVQLKGRREQKIAAVLSVYVEYLEQHRELLRLDAMSHAVLEKNLETSKCLEHKLTFITRLQKSALVIERTFQIEEGRGITLLMRTFAMTRGLWQNYPEDDMRPELADAATPLYKSFAKETHEALIEYWHGALTLK